MIPKVCHLFIGRMPKPPVPRLHKNILDVFSLNEVLVVEHVETIYLAILATHNPCVVPLYNE